MKSIPHFILIVCLSVTVVAYAQEVKLDCRPSLEKEDDLNEFRSNEITKLDVLHALDFVGVRVQKFDLGKFDQKYQLHILAETYEHGEMVKVDTLLAGDNEYIYFEPAATNYLVDYIDQLKFITKSEDNHCELRLHTYALSIDKEIELNKWDDQQFYNWRSFTDTRWKINKKVPLMVFASSWLDKRYNFHRFCGVATLQEGEAGTEELLQNSPTYVLFSYQVNTVD